MSYVSCNVADINKRISEALAAAGRTPEDISLMAVTKRVAPELINEAFDCGVRLFGENRVQEYLSKLSEYKHTTEQTHFIGQLQSNKVKYIIDKVAMIESVSSQKLMKEISKSALKLGRTMDILLEVNIGREETKAGFFPEDINEAAEIAAETEGIRLCGLMAIPPKGNPDYYFAKMQQIFVDISQRKSDNSNISVLSMGMSGDFETAIKYGSNIIRLGTAIFGARI